MSKKDKLKESIGNALLGQFLTEWPDDWKYQKVIDALWEDEREDEDGEIVTVWEPYEDWDTRYLAEIIIDAVDAAVEAAGGKS